MLIYNDKEIWKQVVGYEGLYEVSSHGNLRSPRREIKQHLKEGYMRANLQKDGKQKLHYVHRLVARAFCEGYAEGLLVCHNDGNRANNHYTNVRYDTHKGNGADMIKHGTSPKGERSGKAVLKNEQVREIRRLYATGDYSMNELAEKYNVHHATIWKIVNNKRYIGI